jgi:hypothetical protein
MSRIDVGSAVAPAFDHMVKVLFRPFVLRKWLALGFLALFVGGGGGGAGNWGNSLNNGHGGNMPNVGGWFAHYWPIVAGAVLLAFLIAVFVSWIAAVFNFVYIDDVVRGSGAIKEPFARLKRLGTSLFLWNLVFGLIVLTILIILVGFPLLFAFVLMHNAPDALQVLSVVWAVMAGLPIIFVTSIIGAIARDFVSNAMYARGTGIMAAWKVLLPILWANIGQVILYFLLLLVFSVGIGIASLFAAIVMLMILAIPFGGLALIGYLIGTALHLTWSPPVMAVVALYAGIVGAIFAYLMSCVMQPAMVFLQAFSLIIVGQADPTLETIPIMRPQPVPPPTA